MMLFPIKSKQQLHHGFLTRQFLMYNFHIH